MQYGMPGKAFQGEMLYAADEPAVRRGVHLSPQGRREDAESRSAPTPKRKRRRRASRFDTRRPSELRAEAEEEAPAILLTIRTPPARRYASSPGRSAKGIQRVAWDLRAPAHQLPPNRPRGEIEELFGDPLVGPYVVPGKYSVTLSQRVGGVVTDLAGPVGFNVVIDPQAGYTAADQTARWEFQQKLQALRRDIGGALELATARTRGSTRSCARSTRRRRRRARSTTRRARSRSASRQSASSSQGDRALRVAQRSDAGGDLRAREHDQRRNEPVARAAYRDARATAADRVGAVRGTADEAANARRHRHPRPRAGARSHRRALHTGPDPSSSLTVGPAEALRLRPERGGRRRCASAARGFSRAAPFHHDRIARRPDDRLQTATTRQEVAAAVELGARVRSRRRSRPPEVSTASKCSRTRLAMRTSDTCATTSSAT